MATDLQLSAVWPPAGLALEHDDLLMRSPTDEDAIEFGAIIHRALPPEQHHFMPNLFNNVLADTVAETALNELRWIWSRRAAMKPEAWSLIFAVVRDGEVVGMQDLQATDFAVTRHVSSGSFLAPEARGHRIGLRMRAMVLELAVGELGALVAESGYMPGNEPSRRISERLGYEPNGLGGPYVHGGEAHYDHSVRLTAERWRATRPGWLNEMRVVGLEPCRPLLVGEESPR